MSYFSGKPVIAHFLRQTTRSNTTNPNPVLGFESWDTNPIKFNSKSGVPNPVYKSAISQGISASTGYSIEHWEVEHAPGFVQFDYKYLIDGRTFYNRIDGDLTGFATWPAINLDLSALDEQSITQFLSRCYRAQHSFQGGVFLGELQEAVHMIRHPLDSLISGMSDYLKALRRRKRRGMGHGKRLSKMIADTWLEYVFGWGPLLSDIDSGAKALARASTYRAPSEHVTASAKADSHSDGIVQDVFSPDNQYMFISYKTLDRQQVEVNYEGAVTARSGGNGFGGAIADFGLDFQSFLPTVWELIPYSFLVDYVSNVGQFVEACSFCTSDLIYVTRSTKSRVQRYAGGFKVQNNIEGLPDSYKILEQTINPGGTTMKGSIYQRQDMITSMGVPHLAFTLQNLNFRKGANVGALGAAAASTSRFLNS